MRRGTPVLITEHKGDIRGYWMTSHGRNQIERAYRQAARLHAVSLSHKQSLERLFPATRDAWIVSGNGVDTSIFSIREGRRPVAAATERRILFLGGLKKHKGLPLVLEALGRLPEAFSLTVAGPGAYQAQVASLARRFGVARRVNAVGLVGRREVAALLNEHDVLALGSLYESFGLVCAEALACGTPVVATRCGGPSEIVREPFGRLVEPGDSAAFAAALMDTPKVGVSWDPQLARRYICNQFSMESLASRLEAGYHTITTDMREPGPRRVQ
jgi:glycosyltransferase involved in cell wall biosynthesis